MQHVSGDSVVRAFMRSFSLSLCMRARKVFVSVFFYSLVLSKTYLCFASVFFSLKKTVSGGVLLRRTYTKA